jgi:UDP-2,3-diacylglucosamine pyrophosphatase LpxH
VEAHHRLSQVLASAPTLEFDDDSKLILLSDCHRGDNSRADDFAHNQCLFFHALTHYYQEGFTYIEVGDADELWENKRFADIREAHSHVFWLMSRFHKAGRLQMLYGNHDAERGDPLIAKRTLATYHNERTRRDLPLFDDIQVHEALFLRYSGVAAGARQGFLLTHGHQVDPFNDRWWKLSRLMVRHLWRHLQLLGVRDLTSPAQTASKRHRIERRIETWVDITGQPVIAGHTHRPRYPMREKDPPYFNCGSCVHPRCITGIEIRNSEIALIKWAMWPDAKGRLCPTREVLEGPAHVVSFFPE